MTPTRLPLVLVACLSLGAVAHPVRADEGSIQAIPVYHRFPDELVPLLRPLLQPGEVVIAAGNQLLVRASAETLRNLEDLVRQLDTAPRRLLITVARGTLRDLERQGVGLSGTVRVHPGSSVAGSVQGRVGQSSTIDTSRVLQRVQTVDGQSAMIQLGEQGPWPAGVVDPYNGRVIPGYSYRDMTTGFAVQPRSNGDEVQLRITPWSHQGAAGGPPGSVGTSDLATTIRGRIGEWIELGGTREAKATDRRGLGGSSASARTDEESLFLRVDDLDRAQ